MHGAVQDYRLLTLAQEKLAAADFEVLNKTVMVMVLRVPDLTAFKSVKHKGVACVISLCLDAIEGLHGRCLL